MSNDSTPKAEAPHATASLKSATRLLAVAGEKRRSAGDDAALYIRRLIFDGELTPGQRVPQDQIAEALGVSRIPIREAIIGLEREGWVTIELNRGAFVNAFDEAAVLDHYALYGQVYGFAVARAIERSPGSELAGKVGDIVRRMRREHDPAAFTQLARAFHAAVLDASGSRPSSTLANSLARLIPGDFFVLVPEAMAIERRALPSIARLIEAGDADGASDAYGAMMNRVGQQVLALFEARGILSQERKRTQTRPARRA